MVGEFLDEFEEGVAIEGPARIVVDGQVVAGAGEQEGERAMIGAAEVPAGGGKLDEALVVVAVGGVVSSPSVFPGFVGVPVIAPVKEGDAVVQAGIHRADYFLWGC